METPPSVPEDFTPDPETVNGIIEKALGEGREGFDEGEAAIGGTRERTSVHERSHATRCVGPWVVRREM